MPDNLGTPKGNRSERRPYQMGKAKGTKSGSPVEVDKEWMIDTGAQISAITKANGDKFDLTATGGSANGGGYLIKSGLIMVFEIFDRSDNPQDVECSLDVAVSLDNSSGEILGVDQIAHVDAVVEWDPKGRTGRLRAR